MKPDEPDDADAVRTVVGRWFAESFNVGHNAFEFKVDCGRDEDGGVQTVYLRVIASPTNARELFRQLGLSLLRYADTYGPIESSSGPSRSRA